MLFQVFILIATFRTCFSIFDPVTIGIGIGLGAMGYNYDFVKKHSYCRMYECCIDEYIKDDIIGLKTELDSNLFGQHIVIQQLIPALKAHLDKSRTPTKPLVISFHGTPGTGKNYVSDYIAKSVYVKGLESQYVYKFLGRSDFPLDSKTVIYQSELNDKVRRAVAKCPRSLFIFDEVDKMPPGVFESIASLLDHHTHLDGIDFRRSIFIFLSNTAGVEVSNRLAELMKWGSYRHDTKLHDFEKILELGAYNLDGGLKKAGIIEQSLIDHFIPFLPLEKSHVESCLRAEFRRLGAEEDENIIKSIMDRFVTFDRDLGLFATTGCKRLSKKVEVEVWHKNDS